VAKQAPAKGLPTEQTAAKQPAAGSQAARILT
jgi:hypothetical protein